MKVTVELTFEVDESRWPDPGRGEHTGPASDRIAAYLRSRCAGPLPSAIHAALPEIGAAGGTVTLGPVKSDSTP